MINLSKAREVSIIDDLKIKNAKYYLLGSFEYDDEIYGVLVYVFYEKIFSEYIFDYFVTKEENIII